MKKLCALMIFISSLIATVETRASWDKAPKRKIVKGVVLSSVPVVLQCTDQSMKPVAIRDITDFSLVTIDSSEKDNVKVLVPNAAASRFKTGQSTRVKVRESLCDYYGPHLCYGNGKPEHALDLRSTACKAGVGWTVDDAKGS